jgi:hypothetical protein
VFVYDIENLHSTWQALLDNPVMTVDPLCVGTFRRWKVRPR